MVEKVQNVGTILGKNVWNELGVGLTDRADDSDALETSRPVTADVRVNLSEKSLVKFGGRRQIWKINHRGVQAAVRLVRWVH